MPAPPLQNIIDLCLSHASNQWERTFSRLAERKLCLNRKWILYGWPGVILRKFLSNSSEDLPLSLLLISRKTTSSGDSFLPFSPQATSSTITLSDILSLEDFLISLVIKLALHCIKLPSLYWASFKKHNDRQNKSCLLYSLGNGFFSLRRRTRVQITLLKNWYTSLKTWFKYE